MISNALKCQQKQATTVKTDQRIVRRAKIQPIITSRKIVLFRSSGLNKYLEIMLPFAKETPLKWPFQQHDDPERTSKRAASFFPDK